MANELFARVSGGDGSATVRGLPSGTQNRYHSELSAAGLAVGALCPPKVKSSVLYLLRVPATVTLATGLTVDVVSADEAGNNSVGGLKGYWGVTVAPVTSGTTALDETAFASSTEVKKQTTMPATPGLPVVDSVAVPVANMNGLAAGGWALVRIRRLGDDALDTDTNRVVFLAADLRNT